MSRQTSYNCNPSPEEMCAISVVEHLQKARDAFVLTGGAKGKFYDEETKELCAGGALFMPLDGKGMNVGAGTAYAYMTRAGLDLYYFQIPDDENKLRARLGQYDDFCVISWVNDNLGVAAVLDMFDLAIKMANKPLPPTPLEILGALRENGGFAGDIPVELLGTE